MATANDINASKIVWSWIGESDWIKFSDDLSNKLESCYQVVQGSSSRGGRRSKVDPSVAKVQVDNERFVDLSLTRAKLRSLYKASCPEAEYVALQRRYDDENKRRAVRRQAPLIFKGTGGQVHLTDADAVSAAFTSLGGVVREKKISVHISDAASLSTFDTQSAPVVSLDWLIDCIKEEALLQFDNYTVSPAAPTVFPTIGKTSPSIEPIPAQMNPVSHQSSGPNLVLEEQRSEDEESKEMAATTLKSARLQSFKTTRGASAIPNSRTSRVVKMSIIDPPGSDLSSAKSKSFDDPDSSDANDTMDIDNHINVVNSGNSTKSKQEPPSVVSSAPRFSSGFQAVSKSTSSTATTTTTFNSSSTSAVITSSSDTAATTGTTDLLGTTLSGFTFQAKVSKPQISNEPKSDSNESAHPSTLPTLLLQELSDSESSDPPPRKRRRQSSSDDSSSEDTQELASQPVQKKLRLTPLVKSRESVIPALARLNESEVLLDSETERKLTAGCVWRGLYSSLRNDERFELEILKRVDSSFQGVLVWPRRNGTSTRCSGVIRGLKFEFTEINDSGTELAKYAGVMEQAGPSMRGEVDSSSKESGSFELWFAEQRDSPWYSQLSLSGRIQIEVPVQLTIEKVDGDSIHGSIQWWPNSGPGDQAYTSHVNGHVNGMDIVLSEVRQGSSLPLFHSGQLVALHGSMQKEQGLLSGSISLSRSNSLHFGDENSTKPQLSGSFELKI